MTSTLLLALLICHLLGDFYVQPSRLARVNVVRKVWHGLTYALPYFALAVYMTFIAQSGMGVLALLVATLVVMPMGLRMVLDASKRLGFHTSSALSSAFSR
jgi:hypothetical protein